MNNTYLGKVNTSLVHFLILTIFGALTAFFLVHKADQAISDFDSISDGPYMAALRQATSTQEATDTTGWKTYRNDKYGFEVGYPAEAKVLGTNELIFNFIFSNDYTDPYVGNPIHDEYSFAVQVLPNPNNLSALNFVKKLEAVSAKDTNGPATFTDLIRQREEIRVSGVPAYKIAVFSFDFIEYRFYVPKSSYMYVITYPDISLKNFSKFSSLFAMMIPTFKFIK